MKTIIAGSRYIDDYEVVSKAVDAAHWIITEVVSGGALGVDRQGELWAARNGRPVKTFKAKWSEHGRAAGPIRNREMARYADALILVWNGTSNGSASMKREAEAAGLKILEVMI